MLQGNQARPGRLAEGEAWPDQDHEDDDRKGQEITGKNRIRLQAATQAQGGQAQGDALEAPGRKPQLDGQIGAEAGKDPHTPGSQGVEQVKGAHEQVGNPQEEQVVIFQEAPGIPGDGKDAPGNDDAEEPGDTVEQRQAVAAGQI